MSDIVIKVENLSKRYDLGVFGTGSLVRDLQSWWAIKRGKEDPNRKIDQVNSTLNPQAPGSKPPAPSPLPDSIWALRDVSFEVKQGEIIGIIGKNGAGKSTLLKILTKVTRATSGIVKIKGKVASLLEVGTGFHPELTGRENIYLNGTILGMKKAEITNKFDEIVAFAEIEKFIDTPVKRYSSGMYVRLAFAVAAHLEPEILMVDEVLAVGDLAFQKKCLGKMSDVSREGRTVLFVSHNMQAIRNLCPRTILIEEGEVISDATTGESLSCYNRILRNTKIDAETGVHDKLRRRGGGTIKFTSIDVQDTSGNNRHQFKMNEAIRFKMSYKVFKELRGLAVYIALRSGITREIVTSVRHLLTSEKIKVGATGTVIIELHDIYIRPGEYPLYLYIGESGHTKTNFDVLDDLTPPLVIVVGEKQVNSNFDPSNLLGYFSLPSRIHYNEICENGVL